MGNLFASLDAAAGALRAFRDGIGVSSNNVANASTPGFVRQNAHLEALPFNANSGAVGGVRSAQITSSRSLFAERAVRQQVSLLGNFAQQTTLLSQIEFAFDVSGETGLPSAINDLFNSFAEFSLSPDDPTARQSVLDAAASVASQFNAAANELSRVTGETDAAMRATVENINQVASQVQQYNQRILDGAPSDPGSEAVAFADVESLSQLANVDVHFEENGTMTLLLGGQVPIVIGNNFNPISMETYTPGGATNPGAAPSVRLLDAAGRDITGMISQGQLAGQLQVRTQVLPALAGDATQDGTLNALAKHLAERVNDILTNGQVSPGPPPVAGVALFTFDTASNANTARTLQVNSEITPELLAATSPGPPFVSNGAALELAGLRNSRADGDTIDGQTVLEFYASMARGVGDNLSRMRQEESRSNLLATQARDLRQQLSGVSFDEEAVKLVEFQRAYEANARIVQVVDDMIENVLNMLR